MRVISAIARRLDRTARRVRARFRRRTPATEDGVVRIHLGCGEVDAPGFINVDLSDQPHVHRKQDVRDLASFPDQSADLVYACHVLEHFYPAEHHDVLSEWMRVVRPGGILRISVPDFEALLLIYQACGGEVESIVSPLLGADEGYRSHVSLFNERYLTRLLESSGARIVRRWDPGTARDHDFEDWASRGVVRLGKPWPISLNLEAVK